MKSLIKFLFTSCFVLFLTSSFAQSDYYWVGGSGNWSDYANHWATTSGGTTFHSQAPTSIDNVYFDANSFSEDGQFVTLDISAICHDFDWSAITFNVSIEVGSEDRVQIYGSVALSNSMQIGNNVDIELRSAEAETFSMGDNPEVRKGEGLEGGRMDFIGDGSWTILDHLTNQHDVYINNNATVNLDGNPLYAVQLSILSNATFNTGDNVTIIVHDWISYSSNLSFGSNVEIVLEQTIESNTAQFNGNDNTFPKVTFDVPGEIVRLDGSNTFETLSMIEGTTVEFEGGEIQTITNLEATGSKSSFITFYSDNSGEQAIISKSDGTVDLAYIKLTDIQAAGGATFNAANSVDQGNNTGWNITAPNALDYFWVGGSGNWSDINHWATTSGGTVFHDIPPTEFDNTIFDNNSFTANNQIVLADGDIYCHDMDWSQMTAFDIDLEPSVYNQDDLTITGSYIGSSMFRNDMFRVYMLSTNNDEVVTGNGSPDLGSSMTFQGTGEWNITDNIKVNTLTLNEGSLTITEPEFTINFFDINNTSGDKSVDISNVDAYFDFLRIRENQLASIDWVDVDATVKIEDELQNDAGVIFEHLTLVKSSSPEIEVNGSSNFETFVIEAGANVKLKEGTTQTANNLILEGTKFDQIKISTQSDGVTASLNVPSGTVSGNYLSLKDLAAGGGAVFNAVNSIDLGNNSGWNISAPTPTNYYWIGGTGNWDELFHWSTSSGGDADQPFLPGTIDDIFFDSNSFTEDDQFVILPSGTLQIHDLTINTPFEIDFAKSGSDVVGILGSIDVQGPIDIGIDPNLISSEEETIEIGNSTNISDVQFNGTGTWRFLGSSTIKGIVTLKNGNVDFNEQSVDFVQFRVVGDFGEDLSKSLDASNSEITIHEELYLSPFSFNYTADFAGSTIHYFGSLMQGYTEIVYGGGLTSIAFNDIKIYNQVELRGNYDFNDIEIVAGGISLAKRFSGDVPELKFNTLAGIGSLESPLIFESLDEGVQWEFISKNAENVSLEFANIRDSKATGAVFTANNSTDNGNNEGWVIVAPPNVPDAPILVEGEVGVSSISINWESVENAESYKIEASQTSNFSSIEETQDVLVTNATFVGLDPASTYYFRATAKNAGGSSPLSSVLQTLTKPEAPIANEAFSITTTSFTASWNSSSGIVESYSLDVSSTNDFSSFLEGFENYQVIGNSYLVEELELDETYYYRVRANNASGASENSEVITVSLSTRESQLISFDPISSKVYGDDTFVISATSTSGLDITFQSGNTSIATVNEDVVTILAAGEVNISAFQEGDETYKPATPVSQLLIINKADQTITFEELSEKMLGDENFDLTASASSGLEISFESSNPQVAATTGNTVSIIGVGLTTITASQAGNGNYNAATNVERELAIVSDKLGQTITFGPLEEKVFGDAPFTLTASASSGLAITLVSSDESVATVSGTTVTIEGAGNTIISASQNGNDDFDPAVTVSQQLIVSKADQTITFDPIQDKSLDDQDFSLDAESSSGLAVSFTSSDINVATINGNIVSIVGEGSALITANQAGNSNFNAAPQVDQTLIITSSKQSQTISFGELEDKTFGDAPFQLSATSSAGLDISYESSDESVATISGNEVTMVGAGVTTITASQSGNEDYTAAESVSQSLLVNKSTQTIDFGSIEDKSFGDDPFTLSASASSGLPIAFESSNGSIATISEGQLVILGAGQVTITAKQEGNTNYEAASDVSQVLVIAKADQAITFEEIIDVSVGSVISLSATAVSGLDVSFDVDGPASLEGNSLSILDQGTVTVTAFQSGDENWNSAEPVTQTFEVSGTALGISDDPISIYPNPFLNVLYLNYPEPVDVRIYSLNGSLVLTREAVNDQLEVNTLDEGVYILEMESAIEITRLRIRKVN